MKKRGIVTLSLCYLLMISILTACGGNTAGNGGNAGSGNAGGGTATAVTNAAGDWDILTIGVEADPQSMDPMSNPGFTACQVRRCIYEPLFQFDEDYHVAPLLAESWEYIDDCTIEVHLDPDATFSNGEPVTSEDVIFAFQYSTGVSASTYTVGIDIEATAENIIDDKTFRIITFEPVCNQLEQLCHSLTGIFDKSDFEAKDGDFFAGIAGSGPYVYSDYVSGDSLTLVKNENYWNDEACPDRVNTLFFRFLTEASQRAIEAETGGVDLVVNVVASDVERVKSNPDLQYKSIYTTNGSYIFMNMAHSPLDNDLVREAVKYAVDNESIVEMSYNGLGKPLTTCVVDTLGGCCDVSEFLVERDVEHAKELLAEAGYPDGFTVYAPVDNSYQERFNALEALQAQLADVGITLEIEGMSNSANTLKVEGGEHDLTIYGFSAPSGEAGSTLVRFLPETGTYSLVGYPEDDVLVEYIRNGLASVDTAERDEWYEKAQKRLMELNVIIPHYAKEVNSVMAKYVDADSFTMDRSFETHHFWEVTWDPAYVQ